MTVQRSDSVAGFAAVVSPDEDPRQLAGKLVNAVYRVVKACQLHAESNQAVAQVVDYALATIGQYFQLTGVNAFSILFTPHAVFVNRAMLKTSRETYQLAIELGNVLTECEVTELTISREISAREMVEFGRIVAEFTQTGQPSPRFAEGGWEALKLRRVIGFGAGAALSPPVRAARTYAAALMIVRKFYEDLKKGDYQLKQGIKRVAQKLVSSFDPDSPASRGGGGRLLMSIAAAPSADADRGSVLLSSAIVALAMGSQLTNERGILTSLASAAVLYDAGRQRLLGYDRDGERIGPRTLNQDQEALLPVSSVVALTALGKLHPPSMARAVLVHEAQTIREGGRVYNGRRSPLLLSRILSTAFAFIEIRVPRPGTAAVGIDDALQVLEGQAEDNVGRALVKLLTGALGIFPAGTMVELSTGEMGVVLATPALPVDFARPPVRILYDAEAQLLSEPKDVDLAAPSSDGQARYIKRPIDASDQQMKQMRAYVMQLATKRARKKSMAAMQAMKAPPAAEPSSSSAADSFGSSSLGSSSMGSSGVSGGLSAQSAVPSSTPRDDSFPDLPPVGARPSTVPPESSSAPRARPQTKQWDPRADDGTPGSASLGSARPARVNAPMPQNAGRPGAMETRSLSWNEYKEELTASTKTNRPPPPSVAVPQPTVRTAPPPPPEASLNDTDALLAAYLAEEAEGRPQLHEERPSRRLGLRLGDAPSSTNPVSTNARAAAQAFSRGTTTNNPISSRSWTGTDRDSAVGSNAGLRWGGSKGSSQGRDSFSDIPGPEPTPSPRAAPSTSPSKPVGRQATGPVVAVTPVKTMPPPAFVATPSAPVSSGRQPTVPVVAPRSESVASRRLATGPVVAPPMSTPAPSAAVASAPAASAPAASSGKARAGTAAWSAPTRRTGTGDLPPSIPEPAPPEPAIIDDGEPVSSGVEGPVSKRAKAGTSTWGTAKRDKR